MSTEKNIWDELRAAADELQQMVQSKGLIVRSISLAALTDKEPCVAGIQYKTLDDAVGAALALLISCSTTNKVPMSQFIVEMTKQMLAATKHEPKQTEETI